MRYILILLSVVIFSLTNVANSQPKLISQVANPIVSNFYHYLEMNKPDSAITFLLATNNNIDLTDSSTINLIVKFTNLFNFSGKYSGYKMLRYKLINQDLGVYSYLTKFERKFYRFIFVFYNNNKSIKLYRFSFDDEIDSEIETSLRYYLQ